MTTFGIVPAPGPFPPYSATLDQVLTLIKAMALSPAFQTEVEAYKSQLQEESLQLCRIVDAAGNSLQLNFSPEDGSNLSYIPDSFGQATITPMQKILAPFPICEIVGMPGKIQTSRNSAERFTNQLAEGEVYTIDVYTWSGNSDDPMRNQKAAMTLNYCMKSLLRRNEQLGGIVQLIQSVGPVEPLGAAPPARTGTLVMASRSRWEAYVLLP